MNRQDAEYVAQTAAKLQSYAIRNDLNQGFHVAARDAMTLHRISTQLHRYDERQCNEDLTCQGCRGDGVRVVHEGDQPSTCSRCAGSGLTTGKAIARLEARAKSTLKPYGLRPYFQGDCRGCALYVLGEEVTAGEESSTYNRGHAVCHLG